MSLNMRNIYNAIWLFCKKPIGELNLKRALDDEDTRVFSFFSFLSSSGSDTVSENSTLHQ